MTNVTGEAHIDGLFVTLRSLWWSKNTPDLNMLPALSDVADLFASVEGSAKLELLIDFGERLPPLAEPYAGLRDRGLHMIHECQSPVFLHVQVQGGTVEIHADVPREAAIARGFSALLAETFNGIPVSAMKGAPSDLLDLLGLRDLLSLQRRRGLSAVYRHLLRESWLAFDETMR